MIIKDFKMKLNINSRNTGVNYLLRDCFELSCDYGADEVIGYLIFMDDLNVDMDEI